MKEKVRENSPSNANFVKSMNLAGSSLLKSKFIIVLIVVIIVGIGTGYVFRGKGSVSTSLDGSRDSEVEPLEAKEVVGSDNTTIFKDTATGTLEKGGIDGEGAYHLVRKGGPSQNVYLTSSVVDLSVFVGKEIKVWGETQKAMKAGWLMDVGRVEVL
jgi:hypothetical protein